MGYYEEMEQKRQEERAREAARMVRVRNRIIGGAVAGTLLIGGMITVASCHETIKPGYLGIVYNLDGGIEGGTLTQGWKWIAPWKKVSQYSVATEQGYLSKDSKEGSKEDDSFSIPTSDGKSINVDLEYSYHFDAEKIADTFVKFKGQSGKTIEEGFMRGKLKTWAGEASSKFNVLEIYGDKRSELNAKALEHVKKNFEEYGIVIDSLNFSRIGLDEATEKAIQARINAQQALEQEKIERDKAVVEAQKKEEVAKGDAKAQLIKAQGEAQANKEMQQSITPQLLQKMEMEARIKHGWVTIQGGTPLVNTDKN